MSAPRDDRSSVPRPRPGNVIGPRDPDVETREEFSARVLRAAGRPTAQERAQLAALLGFGNRNRRGGRDAA